MDIHRNVQFTKLFYLPNKNSIRIFHKSPKKSTPHIRRGCSLDDNLAELKWSISSGRRPLTSAAERPNSDFRCSLPRKNNQFNGTGHVKLESINSNSNFCADILRKQSIPEFDNSLKLVNDSSKSLTITSNKHLDNGRRKAEKGFVKSKNAAKKATSEELENLKKEFVILESRCSESLSKSKYVSSASYKTSVNFYKLLQSLYRTIHDITTNGFTEIDQIKRQTTQCADKGIKVSNVSSLENVHRKKVGHRHARYNSSNSINRIKSQRKLLENESVLSTPLDIDSAKIQIGEILNMSRVIVKSKSIVKSYTNFVEVQYLISGLRAITVDERNNLRKIRLGNSQPNLDNDIDITAGSTVVYDTLKKYFNKSVQTSESCNNAASQTTFFLPYNFSEIDETEISQPTSTFSNDDLFLQTEHRDVLNTIYEPDPSDVLSQKFKARRCVHRSMTSSYHVLQHEQFVDQLPINMNYSQIDGVITDLLNQAAYFSMVQTFCQYPTASVQKSKMAIVYTMAYDDECSDRNNNVNVNILLPPNGAHRNEVEDSSAAEIDVPLPESLNSLYERLSKYQIILESIPEDELHSTLEAWDQPRSSGSNSPAFNKSISAALHCMSLCDLVHQNSNNILQTDISGITNSQKRLKTHPEHFNENLEEDQSNATTSLSMLENLIDDFLTQNGLLKISDA